jgi:O-antigen/teichoic acid export membrane protein
VKRTSPGAIPARSRGSGLESPCTLRGAGDTAASYGRAAGLLSLGIGLSGLITYAYFAIASHNLDRTEYGEIVVVWSVTYIIVATLYRPVEQLLSRSLAEREAREQPLGKPLQVAAVIQGGLAGAFAVVALALKGPLEDGLFEGNATLYWVLVTAVLTFAAGYFARGFFAGTRRFGLYVLLLMAEALARLCFAVAVAIALASGQSTIALGIVAGPCLSLLVIPLAFARREPAATAPRRTNREDEVEFTFAHGGGFAAAVLLIMFSEQAFLNAGPLLLRASEGAAAAGFIFNVLMIARAPLVIFQAVATSLLPHLTRLRSRGAEAGERAFKLSVQGTVAVIGALAVLVALAVVVAGPDLMQLAFGEKFSYDRAGLLIVTAGMGFYLAAATLNQVALAQGQVRRAAVCWLGCAAGFVGWNLLPVLDEFRRVEVGFAGAAVLLCGLLYLLYRRPRARPEDVVRPDSPQELEARLAAADEAG